MPTIAEAALPGFDAANWQGMFAPAKTPAAIVNRLNAELRAALALPDIQKQLAANGIEPVSSTPLEFTSLIKSELVKWDKVIKDSGAKAE